MQLGDGHILLSCQVQMHKTLLDRLLMMPVVSSMSCSVSGARGSTDKPVGVIPISMRSLLRSSVELFEASAQLSESVSCIESKG
jgi:hypothetical protein